MSRTVFRRVSGCCFMRASNTFPYSPSLSNSSSVQRPESTSFPLPYRSPLLDIDQLDLLCGTLDIHLLYLSYARSVVFVRNPVGGLERVPILGHQEMVEGTVGYRGRFVQAEYLPHVHGLPRVVLLVVGLSHLRIGLNQDTRLGPVHPGFPRALGADDLAVLYLP